MIFIIIPVIRSEKAERCIEAIKANAGIPEDQYQIIAEEDTDGIGCPRMVARLVSQALISSISHLPSSIYFLFLGDDTIPQPGFLLEALKVMSSLPDAWGVVGLNTQDDRLGPGGYNPRAHWMAAAKMLDHIPGAAFFSVDYHHCYGDDELFDIAGELGHWAFAEKARVLHDHPVNGTAEYDAGYQKAYDGRVDEDRKTYYRRKIARKGLNIAVGFPLTGTLMDRRFSGSYRQAVYTYMRLDGAPSIREYEPEVPIGRFARDIAHNRNDLIRQAFADGVSHLIMMDTDQIYPADIIIKLAAWAARGKDVVIGPVHRRYQPFELILMRGENPDEYVSIPDEEKYSGKMIEIDAAGAGCIMFSLLAALDIDEPWFTLDDKTPGGGNMGEDIAFCWKLRKAGYSIWADTSIDIGHLGEILINREFHEIYQKLSSAYMHANNKS
jgi:hypothetical protein